jgi:hypothetical protein
MWQTMLSSVTSYPSGVCSMPYIDSCQVANSGLLGCWHLSFRRGVSR